MSKLIHEIVENCDECPYVICPLLTQVDNWQCDKADAPKNNIVMQCQDDPDDETPIPIPAWCPLPNSNEKIQQRPLVFFSQLYSCRQKTIEVISWMLKELKWHYRQTKNIPEDLPDSEVDWSPQMKEAMALLEELYQ